LTVTPTTTDVEEDNSLKPGTSLNQKELLKKNAFHTPEKMENAHLPVPTELLLEPPKRPPESPHSQPPLPSKLKSLPTDQSRLCLQSKKTSSNKLEESKKKTEMMNLLDNTPSNSSDGELPLPDNFNGSSRTHGELTGV